MTTRTTPITLGIELTSTGAKTPAHRRAGAIASSSASLTDVAEYISLAQESGADFVVFGEAFRLDDAPRNDAWLDPAIVISRLVAQEVLPDDAPHLVAALPAGFLDPVRLARAVAGIHARSGGRAGWQVPTSATAGGVHAEVRRVWAGSAEARTGGAHPLLVTAPREASNAVVAGEHSDVVRLSATSIEDARAQRKAIRTAAHHAGRNPDDVRVLVDAVTVIGEDASSALFRADMLHDLGDGDTRGLTVAGTVHGVADELARWVHDGAADGFVLIPGSLPTDAVAIARGLAPELEKRGLLAPNSRRAGTEFADLEFADGGFAGGVFGGVGEVDEVNEVLVGRPLVFAD